VFHHMNYNEVEPHSHGEGQFDVAIRPIDHPLEEEGALPFHPQQFWTAIAGTWTDEEDPNDRKVSFETLTVMNRGLPEYEVWSAVYGGAQVGLTLLRCVSQLSARGDGPGTSTPDAQCLGMRVFHYAVMETQG